MELPSPSTRSERLVTIGLWIILIAALIGLGDSIIIHLKEIDAIRNPAVFDSCRIGTTFDCASVSASRYAQFAGVPVSLFGILFYQTAAIGSAAFLLGLKRTPWMRWAISIAIALACVFSFRLLYFSIFAIGKLCIYCLVSNITTLSVAIGWIVSLIPGKRAK